MKKNLITIWLSKEAAGVIDKWLQFQHECWWIFLFNEQDKNEKKMKIYVRISLICQWCEQFFAEPDNSFEY